MAKAKVAFLDGVALEWAAAKALWPDREIRVEQSGEKHVRVPFKAGATGKENEFRFSPSHNLGDCNAIFNEMDTVLDTGMRGNDGDYAFCAQIKAEDKTIEAYGKTRLLAMTRCFVEWKLGGDVEIPDELVAPFHKAIQNPYDLSFVTLRSVDLPGGLCAQVHIASDDDCGPPWEIEDGPVVGIRELGRNENPQPNEHYLYQGGRDKKTYVYDYEASLQVALDDRWGIEGDTTSLSALKIAEYAVRDDVNHLRRWCNDEWRYIGVTVTLRGRDERKLSENSLWGIDDSTEQWREVATEMINHQLQEALRRGDGAHPVKRDQADEQRRDRERGG